MVLKGDVEGPLEQIINTVLKKVRDRRDVSDNTLDYFLVNNPKLGRFYLLPKMHKNVYPISGYYKGNISAFLEFHLI